MAFSATKAFGVRGQAEMGSLLRCGASVVALCAFAASAPAFAQTGTTSPTGTASGPGTAGNTANSSQAGAPTRVADATEPSSDEGDDTIIVTGLRQSLANSQNIKRNSDTVVDAITAQDIGALPDRSVTEALQRVPGVAMNRFAGSNDPDHFSVEGSGVVVRGLSFVRSEFNGRDTFSAGVYGQAINFSDVPSELLGSVEVYKNATAEMIEGGLSGTVNLNTRKPLDNPGFHFGFDAEINYGDMAKKKTPTGSLLISDTWDTGIGRIGILADLSYSQLRSRSDGIQVTNFQTRTESGTDLDINGNPVNRHGLPSNADANNDKLADLLPLAYAPVGGQFRTQDYDRRRTGLAFAAQWESLDRRSQLTAQFLRTDSTNRWGEHTFESAPDLSLYNTYPKGCRQNTNGAGGTTRAECPVGGFTNYQYDADGVFESGYITLPGTGWRTASSGSSTSNVPTGGIQQSLSRREVDDRNVVNDIGLNFKFKATDHWSFNLDGDYTKARHDTVDMSVFGSTFADQELDISGDIPVLVNHKPLTLAATWATPNPRIVGENDTQYFADRDVQFWRAAMDHIEHSEGAEWAFKGDVAYDFLDDVPFLKRVKFGARYADRDQTVRYTTYNWGAISEVWSGTPVSFAQSPQNSSLYSFDNFFRGQTGGPPSAYYYNLSLIEGYNAAAQYFKSINDIWHTTNGATASNRWVPAAERAGVVAGTPFLPSEIQQVSETNKNAYLMLSFGQDEPIFGNVRLDGNIGVRYVNTRVDSVGAFTIPSRTTLGVSQDFAVRCAVQPPPPGAPPGTPPSTPGGICTIGAAAYGQLQTFAGTNPAGTNSPNTAVNKYDYFLPSLNLKFGLTRDLILRFAGSRALARPGQADIRNFVTIGTDTTNGFRLQATAGNPFLKPALSDQFDVTLEWYFARVGSLTFDAFYKKIHNFFYQSITPRSITNNGVTETLFVRGPANYTGSGTVKGFEIAYQQTFDFLPGIFSGLGINANYSHILSKGLPTSFANVSAPANTQSYGNLPLEQLSKHNANVTLFYEKGPVSLRASYNWRSRFLLTSADVIYPFYPIYNDATGQLDASAFFSISKTIKIGIQGVNLLNEITKTSQQFTPGLIGPRSYFMNDRRFSFIIRGNF